MALRFWNQINSIKYLKNGTFRTYTSVTATKKFSRSWNFRNSTKRQFSESKNESNDPPVIVAELQGRFVRTAFPPIKTGEVGAPEEQFREQYNTRCNHGIQRLNKQAATKLKTSQAMVTAYKLKEHSEIAPDEKLIKSLKHSFLLNQHVARLQPQSQIPFCAKDVPPFEREDLRPRKVPLKFRKPKSDNAWMPNIPEESSTSSPDSISIASSISTPSTTPSNLFGHSSKSDNSNFNRLTSGRHFSTFAHKPRGDVADTCLIQKRTLINKDCSGNDAKLPDGCCQPSKKEKKKMGYKIEGRWTKCECCPEMLPCDETTCYNEYEFGCPTENYPTMCPIGCPPPCEPPPPPEMPLRRPPKCPRYQKQKICSEHKCPKPGCPFVPRKSLPPIPKGNCPCVEPDIPCELPKIKFMKRKVFQCTPVCGEEICVDKVEMLVPPKKLPPIIPGDCPCIEPHIEDVPPLPRLNLKAIQKVKQCSTETCPKKPIKYLICKRLPKIKSDCYCVEPEPLKPVKLVRLPPICVCPNPPDPKCIEEKCPVRSDVTCKWKFPKKKLKDWWCPNCKIPKKKYKWCHCHTRGHKDCKRHLKKGSCPNKKCMRCMSTFTSIPVCTDCNSINLPESTFTVRKFSSFPAKVPQKTSLLGTTASLLPVENSLCLQAVAKRQFHSTSLNNFYLTSSLESKDKDKKKKKVKCVKICGTSCCPPAYKRDCKTVKEKCCKARKSPYPSFSECSEYHEMLSCECRLPLPYLQPRVAMAQVQDAIIEKTEPKYKTIDPILEEQCVLKDLCRPFGYTYTCDNFHDGEPVPITQYECFSPHRIPCCERDQICNFTKRPVGKTCEGAPKEPAFFRCQCNCRPPKRTGCEKKKKRCYSTWGAMSSRTFSTAATTFGNSIVGCSSSGPLAITTRNLLAIEYPSAISSKAYYSSDYDCKNPKCTHTCKKKKKRCGKGIRPSMRPGALPPCKIPDEADDEIGTRLKEHFRKGLDCTPHGNKKKLLEEAKCAAKKVGMKLVAAHSDDCKFKKKCPKLAAGKSPCAKKKGECVRPKNVCDECIPRWETGQCDNRKLMAECCEMPGQGMTGEEIRQHQPACCLMPIPICNMDCMRVRANCKRVDDYIPCCVIESPFPAFSDCHPPFKRLHRTECDMKEILEDAAKRRIDRMMANLRKNYSTSVQTPEQLNLLANMIAAVLGESKVAPCGLLDSANCKCAACVSRSNRLLRNVKCELPSIDEGAISNIVMTKEDVFMEVDQENLIPLADTSMTPIENKGVLANNNIKKSSCFNNQGSTRQYSVSRAKLVEEALKSAEKEEQDNSDVITLSEPNDLVYLMDDGKKAINIRPKPAPANKVKVMMHPVCTHIMLDSGELMLEQEYHLMRALLPLKNRIYLPYGLSHDEYLAIEKRNIETVQHQLEKLLDLEEKENA